MKNLLWKLFIALLILSNLSRMAKAINVYNAQQERQNASVTYTLKSDYYLDDEYVFSQYIKITGAKTDAEKAIDVLLPDMNMVDGRTEMKTYITHNQPSEPRQCSGEVDNVTLVVYAPSHDIVADVCAVLAE